MRQEIVECFPSTNGTVSLPYKLGTVAHAYNSRDKRIRSEVQGQDLPW